MSANDKPDPRVTIITPQELKAEAKAFLWFCTACGRVVLSEVAYITEDGELMCLGCRSVDDADVLNDSNID